MTCCFSELRLREVINTGNGERIGYIDDVKINTSDGKVEAVIIYGRPRLFGILGRDEDIVISCENIVMIGTDTVLVKLESSDLCKINKNDDEKLF